jgi:hypothetical protein
MDAIELSVMIKRPIEETFAFLANLENDVKWHSAFVEVRKTSGDSPGVGARFLVFEGGLGRLTPGTEYELPSTSRTGSQPGKPCRDLSS